MNYDAIKMWIDALQFVWIILATIWVFWGDKDRETRARLVTVSEEIAQLDTKVTRLETGALHAPTHQDLGVIHEKLNDVGEKVARMGGDVRACTAEVSGLREIVAALRHQLDIVNEHLLKDRR
jgi:hypothetical protein